MRVTLNLAETPSARERYAAFLSLPVALLALAGCIALCVSGGRNLMQYRQARRDLMKLQEQEIALTVSEKDLIKEFDRPALRSSFNEAQIINDLIDRKRITITDVTARVAKLLPSQVRLTSLSLAPSGVELVVRITVAGNSEENVERFLSNLEESRDFADATILNPAVAEAGGVGNQVSMTCAAHYAGAEDR